MEVHAGKPGKDSKSEILFCPAPSSVYADAATRDDADLSEVWCTPAVGEVDCNASRCQATFATFPKGRPWLTQASASWPLWPARDGPDRQFQQIFLTLSTDTR